jgi:hypothetical protein
VGLQSVRLSVRIKWEFQEERRSNMISEETGRGDGKDVFKVNESTQLLITRLLHHWGFTTTKNASNVLKDLHLFIDTKLKGEPKHDYEDKFKDVIPCKTEAYKAKVHQNQL